MLCQFIARAKHRLLTRDILNNRYTSIHLACRPLLWLRVAQLCITPLLICKNLCRSRGFRLYLLSGERGISVQFVQDSYPLYMCLILPIIRSTMGYWGESSAFLPSQSLHTILSVPHRCNFFVAKMHQSPNVITYLNY